MHLNTLLAFNKHAKHLLPESGTVLEVAPISDESPFFAHPNSEKFDWYGVDVSREFVEVSAANNRVKLTKDPYSYPFKDETFEVILSANVLEHVAEPWRWLQELQRLIKPGGIIVIISPLSWPFHEAPVDCWRIYPDGMRSLINYVGLDTVLSERVCLELEHCGYSNNLTEIPGVTYPGVSLCNQHSFVLPINNKVKLALSSFFQRIPFIRRFMPSVPVAWDCITIATKIKKHS